MRAPLNTEFGGRTILSLQAGFGRNSVDVRLHDDASLGGSSSSVGKQYGGLGGRYAGNLESIGLVLERNQNGHLGEPGSLIVSRQPVAVHLWHNSWISSAAQVATPLHTAAPRSLGPSATPAIHRVLVHVSMSADDCRVSCCSVRAVPCQSFVGARAFMLVRSGCVADRLRTNGGPAWFDGICVSVRCNLLTRAAPAPACSCPDR